ncbi:MAG: S-methyl-5-thioribose-1-phosphate isomerase [Gammaproteobacteria bacterium]
MTTTIAERVWQPVATAAWQDDACVLLDQRVLPGVERYLRLDTPQAVADAIRDMVVRGAPAIGITAAYGAVLAYREAEQGQAEQGKAGQDQAGQGQAKQAQSAGPDQAVLEHGFSLLAAARPTAANLHWALDRVRAAVGPAATGSWQKALDVAREIHHEDIQRNHEMGRLGAALIEGCKPVVTHCNAGALATGGFGTALGVIREAWAAGKVERVYAGETRPWLQGSRLTAWELARDGLPVTVLADSAMAQMFRLQSPGWLIVGADRVAANGDVANKIGTYSLALIARHHGTRVMVVAPSSTVDMATASGDEIPIEQRAGQEVWSAAGAAGPPDGVGFENPAFDVTPAALIDALITEKGVVSKPCPKSMAAVLGSPDSRG